MSDADKALIATWLIENVTADVVPGDEGSDDGLLFNLMGLLRFGPNYSRWCYHSDQEAAISAWRRGLITAD